MAPSDELLMQRIASRDESAFMELYDAYAPRVLGLLRKILGDPTIAEDVLQEVMMEAWQKAPRFDPKLGSPRTWLLMMARARGIDRVRQLARERGRLASIEEAESASPPRPAAAPPSVRDALDRLPEDQRVLISLAFWSGLTREQIAEAQNIPVGTVKTRIRSGIRELRHILADAAVAPS